MSQSAHEEAATCPNRTPRRRVHVLSVRIRRRRKSLNWRRNLVGIHDVYYSRLRRPVSEIFSRPRSGNALGVHRSVHRGTDSDSNRLTQNRYR